MGYRTGKYTVCRRVRASFSLEILQAVAVKGLKEVLTIYLFFQKKKGHGKKTKVEQGGMGEGKHSLDTQNRSDTSDSVTFFNQCPKP